MLRTIAGLAAVAGFCLFWLAVWQLIVGALDSAPSNWKLWLSCASAAVVAMVAGMAVLKRPTNEAQPH